MRNQHALKTAIMAIAIAACVSPAAMAQYDAAGNPDKPTAKKQQKVAPLFPSATRVEPKTGASSTDMDEAIGKLLKTVNSKQSDDDAIAQGEKLAGQRDANKYDRAVIYEAVGYAFLHKKDNAKGADYLQKSLAQDALPNNEQYQLMLQLVDAQIRAGQADAGLATLDRVIAETKQDKPEYSAIRGRVYYAKKDYAAAAQALQKALDSSTQPDPNAQQMLMASYFELKQPERAEKIGLDIVRTHPDDKAAILNLASVYQQAGQPDKAAALLDDARKRGLLTDAKDYRKLYVLYSNIKGRESDSAAVINEGLQKGILQPNAEAYTALGDDYYFMNQSPQALDAYKKADAVSTDGEAALKLAKVYNNQGQAAEAKAAAERALQKGVANPGEAHGIIERAGGAVKKPGKKK